MKKGTIPSEEEIDNYDIELTVDTYYHHTRMFYHDVNYLMFTNKDTKKQMRVEINSSMKLDTPMIEIWGKEDNEGNKYDVESPDVIEASMILASTDYFPMHH